MSDWQPIETFYKRQDRTGKVLLFIPGFGVTEGGCEFTGFHVWKTAAGTFRGGEPPDEEFWRALKGRTPTHWMPLPNPPEQQS